MRRRHGKEDMQKEVARQHTSPTCKNMRPFHCWIHTVEHSVLVQQALVVHGSTRNDAGSQRVERI